MIGKPGTVGLLMWYNTASAFIKVKNIVYKNIQKIEDKIMILWGRNLSNPKDGKLCRKTVMILKKEAVLDCKRLTSVNHQVQSRLDTSLDKLARKILLGHLE